MELQPYFKALKMGYTIIELCDHAVRVLYKDYPEWYYFTSITTSSNKTDNKYILHYYTLDKDEAQKLADTLEAEHPAHKIKVVQLLDIYRPSDFEPELQAMLQEAQQTA